MEYEEVEVNSERWFDLTPLLNEEFRDIEGFEELYQVSNYGRVKSINTIIIRQNNRPFLKREKILKSVKRKGYLRIRLSKICDKTFSFSIHRLVAKAFLKNYNDDLQVNHINGIKTDNRIKNLEMVTPSQNMLHSYKYLNRKKRKKSIQMLDKNKKIIEEFDCIADATKKYGYLDSTICNACKYNQFRYGYYWKYKED